MPRELELKLCFEPDHAQDLCADSLLAGLASQLYHYHATYFDTPDFLLAEHKIGLRVRKEQNQWVQALKTANAAQGGLHNRQEWEWPLPDAAVQPTLLPNKVLADLGISAKQLSQILQPVFTTEFQRTVWQIVTADGSQIECCLDLGEIVSHQDRTPICELELELKSGHAQALYTLALQLSEHHPLVLENRSKAQRGYALHRPTISAPCKAQEPILKAKYTVEEAFIAIIRSCQQQILGNLEAAHDGANEEGVHQMRVGLRRLRSALALFKPVIATASHETWKAELRWINSILGPARDWDVFASNIAQLSASGLCVPGLVAVESQLAGVRERHYSALRNMLKTPRFTRWILQLEVWLAERKWRNFATDKQLHQLDDLAQVFALTALGKEDKKVLKKGGRYLSQLSATKRHLVRIKSKKLAYSIRFFKALFPTKTTTQYSTALSVLRDELGILNDGQTASLLLDELGLPANAATRYAIAGWYAAIGQHHLVELDAHWQAFSDAPRNWQSST